VTQPVTSQPEELLVGATVEHRLSDAQGDDLRVADPSLGVAALTGRRSSTPQ
jgi:hypothetical protein